MQTKHMLSVGDGNEGDALSGRFAFADPRMPLCCREESDRMTTPHFPLLKPGSMIVFPSTAVHLATPYRGATSPRITISWNINAAPLPGSPQDDTKREIPPHPDQV